MADQPLQVCMSSLANLGIVLPADAVVSGSPCLFCAETSEYMQIMEWRFRSTLNYVKSLALPQSRSR